MILGPEPKLHPDPELVLVLMVTHRVRGNVLPSDGELEELGDVDDDAEEDDREDVGQDSRPLGRVGDRVVILNRFGHCQVPLHSQGHRDVDTAAEVDVPVDE